MVKNKRKNSLALSHSQGLHRQLLSPKCKCVEVCSLSREYVAFRQLFAWVFITVSAHGQGLFKEISQKLHGAFKPIQSFLVLKQGRFGRVP